MVGKCMTSSVAIKQTSAMMCELEVFAGKATRSRRRKSTKCDV